MSAPTPAPTLTPSADPRPAAGENPGSMLGFLFVLGVALVAGGAAALLAGAGDEPAQDEPSEGLPDRCQQCGKPTAPRDITLSPEGKWRCRACVGAPPIDPAPADPPPAPAAPIAADPVPRVELAAEEARQRKVRAEHDATPDPVEVTP